MADYDIALISGAMGIAGTLLGVIFTHRLSMKSADRQFIHLQQISKIDAWHVAAQNFVSAFSEELATVEGREEIPILLDEYLRRAYHAKHKAAITAFRHFLDGGRRDSFDAACKEYQGGKTMDEMIETGISAREAKFIEYMGSPFPGNPFKKAEQRMHTLLEFAKHK